MKEITLKAHIVNGDPEHLLYVHLSTDQLNSLVDQRAELLRDNIPLADIEVVIEIHQVVATLFGHKCKLVISNATD